MVEFIPTENPGSEICVPYLRGAVRPGCFLRCSPDCIDEKVSLNCLLGLRICCRTLLNIIIPDCNIQSDYRFLPNLYAVGQMIKEGRYRDACLKIDKEIFFAGLGTSKSYSYVFVSALYQVLSQYLQKENLVMEPKNIQIDEPKQYHIIMERLRRMLENVYDTSECINICNFFLSTLGGELAWRPLSRFVRGLAVLEKDDSLPIGSRVSRKSHRNVCLAGNYVIAQPWDDDRLLQANTEIVAGQTSSSTPIATGVYYEQLRLIVLSDGNHRVSLLRDMPDATVSCDVYDISDCFDTLDIWCDDKLYWYDLVSGKQLASFDRDAGRCDIDYLLAAMYSCAKLKWEYQVDKQYLLSLNRLREALKIRNHLETFSDATSDRETAQRMFENYNIPMCDISGLHIAEDFGK